MTLRNLRKSKRRVVAVLAGSLGSAALILTTLFWADMSPSKPNIEVTVSGVPDYIRLGTTFELAISYENKDENSSGPLRLSASLPDGFTLHSSAPAAVAEEKTLVWEIASLAGGERGSVSVTLQGLPPDNTSGATYDYEGYGGYAAFEEGFELTTRVTTADGVQLAESLVKADTGGINEIDLSWRILGNPPGATWSLLRPGAGVVGSGKVAYTVIQQFTDDSVESFPPCTTRYQYQLRVMVAGRIILTEAIEAEPTYCFTPPA